jgi:LysM repeat protein
VAVVGGFLVVVVIVAAALHGGGSSGGSKGGSHKGQATRQAERPKTKASVYVVKNGDTLTAIAHETGVPVARIQQLNPEVDPQILISGEKLKLR